MLLGLAWWQEHILPTEASVRVFWHFHLNSQIWSLVRAPNLKACSCYPATPKSIRNSFVFLGPCFCFFRELVVVLCVCCFRQNSSGLPKMEPCSGLQRMIFFVTLEVGSTCEQGAPFLFFGFLILALHPLRIHFAAGTLLGGYC